MNKTTIGGSCERDGERSSFEIFNTQDLHRITILLASSTTNTTPLKVIFRMYCKDEFYFIW